MVSETSVTAARTGNKQRLSTWMRIMMKIRDLGILGAGLVRTGFFLMFCYFRIFEAGSRFTLEGRVFPYFYHRYNNTFVNERAVEVPVIWELVKSYRAGRILEIGNVLSHYYTVSHDIIDKYEIAPGVVNQDAAVFRPAKAYDLIVSISTFEHIGWDESPRDPMKPLRAVENLRHALAPGGLMVITVPIGYNPHLDALLTQNLIPFTKRLCLKCISRDNRWQQVDWDQICCAGYDTHFSLANGLLIGFIEDIRKKDPTKAYATGSPRSLADSAREEIINSSPTEAT